MRAFISRSGGFALGGTPALHGQTPKCHEIVGGCYFITRKSCGGSGYVPFSGPWEARIF